MEKENIVSNKSIIKNINVKFDGSLPQKMSEDEVHLKELMKIPGIKTLFEEHGYATHDAFCQV